MPKEAKQPEDREHSITDVNMVWRGPKSPHSFRCSDKLWKRFVSEIKASGDSVCHVMEAIVAGVLGVLHENDHTRNTKKEVPPVVIENLHVRRVVKRRRRYARSLDRDEEVVQDRGSFESCAFCDNRPIQQFFYWNKRRTHCNRLFICDEHQGRVPAGYQGRKEL